MTDREVHGPIGRLRQAAVWFEEHYCRVDLRWLGVFRVVLGLLLSIHLLNCWANASDFYTNDGVLPNHFSLFRPLGRGVFSLFHACSTLAEVSVGFALTLLVFLCFTVGYRTRLFHVLSLVLVTSLDSRNLLVENGGTVVVNLLTFWTLFLPLGRRISIDALFASLRERRELRSADLNQRPERPEGSQNFYSLVVFALLLQWSAIYFFNVVHKSGMGWRNGSALHWFLHQDRIVTWFGIFAREHAPPWLLTGFTYATLVVEGALCGILLVPFQQVWLRRLAFLLAVSLHGGIAATSRLGPFSYIMTIFFIWPLSAADWRGLTRRFAQGREKLTLIYDADCGICFQICRVLARWDGFQRLQFVGNDEREHIPAGLSEELLDQTLVVIAPDGKHWQRERAVSAVLSALPFSAFGLGLLLRVPGIAQLARWGYVNVAERRHQISARLGLGHCGVEQSHASAPPVVPPVAAVSRLWPDAWTQPRLLVRELLVVACIVMAFNQLANDNDWARRRIQLTQPAPLLAVVDTLRLYQGWRMFAPEPPYEDGKLVVDGRTTDGRKIDPLTGLVPDFNPETRVGWGHNQFWCDYHLKMYFARYAAYRQHFREYLERYQLRTKHPEDQLVAFDVWWVNDKSPQPGSIHGEPQPPVKILSVGEVRDSGASSWL